MLVIWALWPLNAGAKLRLFSEIAKFFIVFLSVSLQKYLFPGLANGFAKA